MFLGLVRSVKDKENRNYQPLFLIFATLGAKIDCI
jgi:hypothetical protein